MKRVAALILFATMASLTAQAQSISMARSAEDDLILSGPSCQKVLEQHQALCQWKKNLDPSFEIPAQGEELCKKKSNKVTIEESECLPDFVKKYADKKLARHGPNCWGTALSLHGLSPKPRFVWPEEIQYWMESPMCRKLAVGEEMQPGDVINIYAPEVLSKTDLDKQLNVGTQFWQALYPNRFHALTSLSASGYTGYQRYLHSVTYLTKDLAFGKDSPNLNDRFYFHALDSAYGRPGSGEVEAPTRAQRAYQENQSLVPYTREYSFPPKDIQSSPGSYFSLAYRCGNIVEQLAAKKLSAVNQARMQNIFMLQAIQEKLFNMVVASPMLFDRAQASRALALSDLITAQDRDLLAKKGLNVDSQMILTLEYFTAAAIRKSFEQANLPPSFLNIDATVLAEVKKELIKTKPENQVVVAPKPAAPVVVPPAVVPQVEVPVIPVDLPKRNIDVIWKKFAPYLLTEVSTRFNECRARSYFTRRLKFYCLFSKWTVDDVDHFRKTGWNWAKERAARNWVKDSEVVAWMLTNDAAEGELLDLANARAEDESDDLIKVVLDAFYQ